VAARSAKKRKDAIALLNAGYSAADDEMDFSMRYAITRNFEVYFDASNLLNQPGRRFSEPGNLLRIPARPRRSPTT